MPTTDPRIDAFIAKAQPFAHPILTHLRDVVHRACPDVEETIKWGMPFFLYKGILCNMASFKAHCAFGLWKGGSIVGEGGAGESAMGQFGRITSVDELPPRKVLEGYIKAAMRRNEELAAAPARAKSASTTSAAKTQPKKPKPAAMVPDDLAAALKKSAKARATFDDFSPSHRREYIDWIEEAKTDATRARRLTQAIEWLADGKSRMWKYDKARS